MSTQLGDLIVKYAGVYKEWNKFPTTNASLKLELYELETEIFEELLHKRYHMRSDENIRSVLHKADLFDDIKRKCESVKE